MKQGEGQPVLVYLITLLITIVYRYKMHFCQSNNFPESSADEMGKKIIKAGKSLGLFKVQSYPKNRS